MKCFKKKNSGQSLIEVVVAVGMMALLLTAVLSLIALSVKNSRLANDRTKAVAFAQQGVELMRAYRDLSWNRLLSQVDNNTVYDLPENWTVGPEDLSSPCVEKNIYGVFTRCVTLVDIEGVVSVVLTVSWVEGSQTYQTVQTTRLSLWER